MPPQFCAISDKEFGVQSKEWEKDCEAAKQAGKPTPPPPLGLEQREVCRNILPVLHAMKVAHDAVYSETQKPPERSVWMERAKAAARARGFSL